jgi:sialate O-acetylesterase
LENHKRALEKLKAAKDPAKSKDKKPPQPPPDPMNSPYNGSAILYNAMIAPLIPYAIKGAIWYQGESNASRALQYRTLFPAMIKNWRDDWKQGDFPFLFVQLAPWNPNGNAKSWPELWESQLLTSLEVPRTGMAVITDVGDEFDIHPQEKETVGLRLSLAARGIAYGESIVYSGPIYESMTVDGEKVVLGFKHVGSGLVAQGGPLRGFTISGSDHKFHDAEATIEGDKVVVWSAAVKTPVAVRYGWSGFPKPSLNLWNKDGLPASPFRTDVPAKK